MTADVSGRELAEALLDARRRLLDLVADLDDREMLGPRLSIVNPPLWEIGHVGWFQEKWLLRQRRKVPPLRADADGLFDSAAIAHDTRWDLALPRRDEVEGYLNKVLDVVVAQLHEEPVDDTTRYFAWLVLNHEDMHGEALAYTRQTHGWPKPKIAGSADASAVGVGSPWPGDAEIPGGTFLLGAPRRLPFVFDNEKWAHRVEVAPFRIAKAAVRQEEFLEFVEAGGYRRREWWSQAGWRWKEAASAEHPIYWKKQSSGRWLRRWFDCWLPLEPNLPVIHVNWHEATAYCGFRGRRLPTEAEWELAAAGTSERPSRESSNRVHPWGDEPASPRRAQLDGTSLCCAPVDAHPEGDGSVGCRQMEGNVWEWTASDFLPYPAFSPDPYREYSEPWFGDHKALRGGCLFTRSRLLRNTYRNFYLPDRRDIWAGFRTAADAR